MSDRYEKSDSDYRVSRGGIALTFPPLTEHVVRTISGEVEHIVVDCMQYVEIITASGAAKFDWRPVRCEWKRDGDADENERFRAHFDVDETVEGGSRVMLKIKVAHAWRTGILIQKVAVF